MPMLIGQQKWNQIMCLLSLLLTKHRFSYRRHLQLTNKGVDHKINHDIVRLLYACGDGYYKVYKQESYNFSRGMFNKYVHWLLGNCNGIILHSVLVCNIAKEFTNMNEHKESLDLALSQIEKQFGKVQSWCWNPCQSVDVIALAVHHLICPCVGGYLKDA